ncbi:MAG TPA: helix-turn-helix transcriptional regulator [Vineibacter sp.]|nr:helix-turn-helix transcriptional regulator [Vineibacter sp.]
MVAVSVLQDINAAPERARPVLTVMVNNRDAGDIPSHRASEGRSARFADSAGDDHDVQGYLQRQLARVLQFMPGPALLMDAQRRIVTVNPPAEALLREGDGIVIGLDGSLQATAAFPAESRALGRCLAAALSVAAGEDVPLCGPLRVSRPSGRAPLLVIAAPLPPVPSGLHAAIEGGMALILIVDPEAQPRDVTSALQAAAGLTPAEARVAMLIGGGFSRPQAAAMLNVSPSTANCQLASCFEKLGVRSQVGLARLMSALPETVSPAAADAGPIASTKTPWQGGTR